MKRSYPFLVLIFSTLFILSFISLSAKNTNEDEIRANLPKMLGASNIANEYWLTIPPCFEDESSGYQNFIKIFVTSSVKTLVSVEVPGRGFLATKNTNPNDVIEFNIPAAIATVWQKKAADMAPPEQVYKGYGIHVKANDLIIVYVMVRYHWTSDGFLAIPVTSLGRNYIVSSYPDMSAMYQGYLNNSPSESGIVAAYPDTKVNFTLGGNTVTKTAGGMKPGQTVSAVLQPGDVWMFATWGPESDLSGSIISSNKPVGVVSGNYCTNIPTSNRWCDYTVEMDIPTESWGYDYHVGKIALPKRKYPSIVRIYAKENTTKIYRNGKAIGQISKGGGKINEAYYEFRMGPMDSGPVSAMYSGDKPIGVTLYNTGTEEDGTSSISSDPFVMSITPVEQYQTDITFCTPGINGGQGFPFNYVNLVYQLDENNAMSDDYEFGYFSGGNVVWEKINTKFSGVDDIFAKAVHNKNYGMKTITLPGDGVYKIRSSKPFAAYSYGFSDYDSYGYPATALFKQVGNDDSIPPRVFYTEKSGDVDGTVTDDAVQNSLNLVTATATPNLGLICFHSSLSNNYKFESTAFVPGETNTTNWSLKVIDKTKDANAVITFTDRNGNDNTVFFDYAGNPNGVKEETGINGITLYPNPANNILNIKFGSAINASLNIYMTDLLGRKVMDISNETASIMQEQVKEVNLRSLNPGVYYIVIEAGSDKKIEQVKIVR